MEQKPPELLVTITFRVPVANHPTIRDKVAPVVQSAMNVGGDTAHVDISWHEERLKTNMWVFVVLNEDTHEVHVYGGAWDSEEEGAQAARDFIEKFEGDSSALLLTVTEIEKA